MSLSRRTPDAVCLRHLDGRNVQMNPGLQYLTEKEVSQMTRRALSTLRNERAAGRGIPYIKVGRSVRYDLKDVVEFMDQRKVRTNVN